MPDVEEFDLEQLLAFEKEVLGVYASGHPLEQYEALWRKNITALTSDFMINDETGQADRLIDQSVKQIGGIVENVTTKYTKNGSNMAFLQVEDLVGSVEVLVFPRVYERYRACCVKDERIFVSGKVSLEDNKNAKLLADRICRFQDVPQDLWLRFSSMDAYLESEQEVFRILTKGQEAGDEGPSGTAAGKIMIYVEKPRSAKELRFPGKMYLPAAMITALEEAFGKENISQVPGRAPLCGCRKPTLGERGPASSVDVGSAGGEPAAFFANYQRAESSEEQATPRIRKDSA